MKEFGTKFNGAGVLNNSSGLWHHPAL
jgi:hypothetical protein